MPALVRRNAGRTKFVVKAINGAATISVEPGAISAKGDEIGKRKLFVSKLTLHKSRYSPLAEVSETAGAVRVGIELERVFALRLAVIKRRENDNQR